MNKLLALSFALVLAFGPAASRAADTLEIPVILAISGPLAIVGQPLAQSLEALQKSVNQAGGVNGRPVQFTILDDASNLETTVQLANQLINKKVPIFLGPTNVASCRAVAPLVTTGPLQYCSPAVKPLILTPAATRRLLPLPPRWNISRARLSPLRRADPTDATTRMVRRWPRSWLPAYRDITVVAQSTTTSAISARPRELSRIKAPTRSALRVGHGAPIGSVLRNIRDGESIC